MLPGSPLRIKKKIILKITFGVNPKSDARSPSLLGVTLFMGWRNADPTPCAIYTTK